MGPSLCQALSWIISFNPNPTGRCDCNPHFRGGTQRCSVGFPGPQTLLLLLRAPPPQFLHGQRGIRVEKQRFSLPGTHVLWGGFALARTTIRAGLFSPLDDCFEGLLEPHFSEQFTPKFPSWAGLPLVGCLGHPLEDHLILIGSYCPSCSHPTPQPSCIRSLLDSSKPSLFTQVP